jgi:serine/threonine protein kinase
VAPVRDSRVHRSYSHIGKVLTMSGFVGMRIGGPSGDRYELVRPLGSGAFGDAWEAHDHDEDSTVAVKLLSPGTNPDDVLREASLHRRLSAHPRVVPMRNVEIGANPSSFVVSELVPGGSLDGVLAVRRPTVVESQRWLRDVLEGLAHAHGMSVLHRDVKASNVLLGPDGHAMLTDFGVADDSVRRAAAEPAMYPLTMPPEFGFTPGSGRR